MTRIAVYALAAGILLFCTCAPSPCSGDGVFAYSLEQMNVILHFKPAQLLTKEEKARYRDILEKRRKYLKTMDLAVRTGNGRVYYDAMKHLLLESTVLKETTRKMKNRIDNAIDRLYADFEVFGDRVDSWPSFAKAEEEKLRKGSDAVDKIKQVDDLFFKYIQARLRSTYEICVTDPDTFDANSAFLKTGTRASREILDRYEKLLDALIKADEKARKASGAQGSGVQGF